MNDIRCKVYKIASETSHSWKVKTLLKAPVTDCNTIRPDVLFSKMLSFSCMWIATRKAAYLFFHFSFVANGRLWMPRNEAYTIYLLSIAEPWFQFGLREVAAMTLADPHVVVQMTNRGSWCCLLSFHLDQLRAPFFVRHFANVRTDGFAFGIWAIEVLVSWLKNRQMDVNLPLAFAVYF